MNSTVYEDFIFIVGMAGRLLKFDPTTLSHSIVFETRTTFYRTCTILPSGSDRIILQLGYPYTKICKIKSISEDSYDIENRQTRRLMTRHNRFIRRGDIV